MDPLVLTSESQINLKRFIKNALFSHSSFSLRLTFCLPVSSTDDFCKQFGPRSGPTKRRARSGSKLFGNLMVFLN